MTKWNLITGWVHYENLERFNSLHTLPSGVQACGHRYVKIIKGGNEEQRRMVGKCYVRSNDLTYDGNDHWQENNEICNPNLEMEFESMCNLGISGGITETDVYVGTPGSFVWRGGHWGVNDKKSAFCCWNNGLVAQTGIKACASLLNSSVSPTLGLFSVWETCSLCTKQTKHCCLILLSYKGNVHVTWRDPDPEAWDSRDREIGKREGDEKRRNSYMGNYTVCLASN